MAKQTRNAQSQALAAGKKGTTTGKVAGKVAGKITGKGAVPAATLPPFDAAAYRNLMRHQAGGVAIIACGKPGGRTGLTATAVCSISDTPPTLLICVNRNASGHPIITKARCFAVNFLADEHDKLAMTYSGKAGLEGEARFVDADWTTLATGAPVLKSALATLDCEVVDEHSFDTHTLFIGRVKAGHARDETAPLVYLRGAFWDLTRRG